LSYSEKKFESEVNKLKYNDIDICCLSGPTEGIDSIYKSSVIS